MLCSFLLERIPTSVHVLLAMCKPDESWKAWGEENTGLVLGDSALALPSLESGLFSYNYIWVEYCPDVTPSNSVLALGCCICVGTKSVLSESSIPCRVPRIRVGLQ